jgi:ABC-type transport system involved in multi-copper enzyme maturation permease subunit
MSSVVIAETLRRHLTSVGYVAYTAVLALVALTGSQIGSPAGSWPPLIALLAIVAGASVIGPEFSSGTLQLILVKPIRRATYLVSRATGVVLAVWLAALVALVCELLARSAASAPVPWQTMSINALNAMLDSVLVVALLALFGSMTRAYYNVALYFTCMLGLNMTMGLGARKLPKVVLDALHFVDRNLFPDAPPRFDRDWILLVLSNAAIAIVLACFVFRRREVPYGAE